MDDPDWRSRRLFEFEGETIICQQRWRCLGCDKVVTVFDDRVVPRHLYARAVIVKGLMRRREGATWDHAAGASTADGQLDPSTLKRWWRRFQLDGDGPRRPHLSDSQLLTVASSELSALGVIEDEPHDKRSRARDRCVDGAACLVGVGLGSQCHRVLLGALRAGAGIDLYV